MVPYVNAVVGCDCDTCTLVYVACVYAEKV